MTLRDVQEVARLAADNGMPVHGGGPTVHKVADALGLPPSDVEALLDQARDGRSPIRDFKIVLGIAALLLAFLLGLGTTRVMSGGSAQSMPVAALPATPTQSGVAAISPQASAPAAYNSVATASLPVPSGGDSSQMYAPGAPVEAKTFAGDVRNGIHKARQREVLAQSEQATAAQSAVIAVPQ